MFRLLKTLLAAATLLMPLAAGVAQAKEPTRFTVAVRGSGPDIILIPGLASSRDVWSATAKQLEGRYRVHLVQVAGFAGAPAGGNADGPVVEPLADEIVAYIEAQHLDHPAIIGHSMGGFTALMIAAHHPDAVGRVMVVDTLPFFSVLFGPTVTVDAVRPQAAAFRDAVIAQTPEVFAAGQDRVMAGLVRSPEARAAPIAWSLATDRGVMARATYDVMTTDLRGDLARITAPVTVLYARDPGMGAAFSRVDPLYTDNYAALKGVRLRPVDGAFHFIMLDQPQAFAAEVEAFLH